MKGKALRLVFTEKDMKLVQKQGTKTRKTRTATQPGKLGSASGLM